MCIIAICNERKMDANEIKECGKSNRHGVGMAWRDGEKTHYIKGLMTEEAFKAVYDELPEGTQHVVHFRTSTANGVREVLTHPFVCSDAAPNPLKWSGDAALLFHNGVWSSWEDKALEFFTRTQLPIPEGVWSDTRVLAVMVGVMGPNLLKFASGKFVHMTPKGVWYYGDFVKEEGILFSNNGYKSWGATNITYYNDDVYDGVKGRADKDWRSDYDKKKSIETALPAAKFAELRDQLKNSGIIGKGGSDSPFVHRRRD